MARAKLRGTALSKASSQKTSCSTTPRSKLPLLTSDPLGDQPRLERLVSNRAARGLCLECGKPRAGCESYCKTCLVRFPIITDVENPFDGWKYFVSQNKPAYDGPAFHAMRCGVFERVRQRPQWLGSADTFNEAREICLKRLRRAWAAAL